jgi:hypothetical protein
VLAMLDTRAGCRGSPVGKYSAGERTETMRETYPASAIMAPLKTSRRLKRKWLYSPMMN